MKRVGFYGGTFDPPHFGHLNIVISLLEREVVNEIFICPTASSTFKGKDQIQASPQERLEMVRLLFRGIPSVTISEIEIFQQGPVYTIDTLRFLKGEFSNIDWVLILGEDVAFQLPEWKGAAFLIEEFPLIICPRNFFQKKEVGEKFALLIQKGKIEIPIFDISSTEVKNRLIKNLFCEHLIHRKVLDFIKQKSLYFSV